MNTMRSLIHENRICLGGYIGDMGATMCEMACMAGYDFLRIDMEHTYMPADEMKKMIHITETYHVPILVRCGTKQEITRLLDYGVTGILVPDVENAKQAKEMVRWTKYYPIGNRGMTNISRCVRYGLDSLTDYVKSANKDVCLCVQIESEEGVNNIHDIIAVEGIDLVTIGQLDMSQSYGVPGQAMEERVQKAYETVVQACLESNMPMMLATSSKENLKSMCNRGVNLFTIMLDTSFVMKAVDAHIKEYKYL